MGHNKVHRSVDWQLINRSACRRPRSYLVTSISVDNACLKRNGLNGYPSALKNLFWNSTHCSRSECKKHSSASMQSIIPNVIAAKIGTQMNSPTACTATLPDMLSGMSSE
eukprot:Selendium_serpulae@DN5490_c0_g1_i3.p1